MALRFAYLAVLRVSAGSPCSPAPTGPRLTATAVAIVAFFARDRRGENAWRRLIAPGLAAMMLGGIVVLATMHYATLLGVPPGSRIAWLLPASYLAIAVVGEV